MRVLLVLVIGLVACKEANPLYCPGGECSDATIPSKGCTSNADCANAMVCDIAGDQTCVQCLAPGEDPNECIDPSRPICDNRACRGCSAHSDCGSQVCLADGTCAVEATVAYLAGLGDGGTDNTTCTKAMPCTKIQKALDRGLANLKFHGTLEDGVMLNRSVAMYADPGASLTRTSNGTILVLSGAITVEINDLTITTTRNTNDHCISTTGTSKLTLNRVTVSKAIGNGISCAGSSLVVNHSTISRNGQFGISCMAGVLAVSASTVYGNGGGGIVASNVSFDITNSFVVHNGALGSSVGGVSLAPPGGSTNRFEFNTISDNDARDSTILSAGVLCDVVGFSAANNVISRNALNGDRNKANANINGACMYPTSTIATDNTDLKFVNPDSEPFDYSLRAGSTAIDKATTASTVNVDYKGTARPQGANKDQGADEYKP